MKVCSSTNDPTTGNKHMPTKTTLKTTTKSVKLPASVELTITYPAKLEAVTTFMRNDGRFYLGTIERETFGV